MRTALLYGKATEFNDSTVQRFNDLTMNVNLRNITNSFLDVRLVSLSSWRQANEIQPRDHGGPYVVLQEGYDPKAAKVIADEFILGRSGKWIPLGLFYRLPVPERRAEYIFGTAGEVMQMMSNLPSSAEVIRGSADVPVPEGSEPTDEMASALKAAKNKPAPDAS